MTSEFSEAVDGFPLSLLQRRIWRLRNGKPETLRSEVVLSGQVDPLRMQQAIEAVVARHDILRTVCIRPAGLKTPLQMVRATTVRDASILRWRLEPLSAQQHRLVLELPSCCADQRTLDLFVAELAEFYASTENAAEDEEWLQYLDYSQWQHDLLAEDDDDRRLAREFWHRLPDAMSPGGILPSGNHSDVAISDIPANITARLHRTCGDHDLSPAHFLFAVWSLLLLRASAPSDAVVAWRADGRAHEMLANVLGPIDPWLPIPVRMAPQVRFRDFAHRLKDAIREAEHWQQYFDAEEDRPVDPTQYGFDYQSPMTVSAAGRLTFQVQKRTGCWEPFRLQLVCTEQGPTLQLALYYATALMERTAAERWAARLSILLDSALSNIDAPITQLPLLPQEEQAALLQTGRGNAAASIMECWHQTVLRQSRSTPDRIAVVCGADRISYEALATRASHIAAALQTRGIGTDDVVGLCADRSVDFVAALLGIHRAGAAFCPLDPSQPTARLRQIVETIRPPVVLTPRQWKQHVVSWEAVPLCLEEIGAAGTTSPEFVDPPIATANLAYVLFTSGSTGQPKGVAVEHRQLMHYIAAITAILDLPESASFAHVSTLTADLGHTALFPPLCRGGTLHLVPEEFVFDPAGLAELFTREPVDCLKLTPSHMKGIRLLEPARVMPERCLVLGGEALDTALIAELQATSPACRLLNHYGPTEVTVGTLTGWIAPESSGAIGFDGPLSGVQAYVLDAGLQLAPYECSGELYLGGATVSRGYLNRPAETASRFVPNPFALDPGGRLYRTGDHIRRHAQQWQFLGRTDNQIKLRGYRIELGDIEVALRTHSAVKEAVALIQTPCEGESRLAAFVVPVEPTATNHSGTDFPWVLRNWLAARLPDYMMPALLIVLPRLPLTSNGKIDRRALAKMEAPATTRQAGFIPPKTPMEEALARIWSEVLHIPQVGRHDNFFDLGGDSILSIQVVATARRSQLRIMPAQVFQFPTVAQLATVASYAAAVEAEQGAIVGPVPLAPIQRRFFAMPLSNRHHWNMAFLLEIDRPLNPGLLTAALSQLLHHHDLLRARYTFVEGIWQQNLGKPRIVTETLLGHVDLRGISVDHQKEAIERAATFVQTSLHLTDGPLLRGAYFSTADGRDRLLFVAHHLIVDGVSWRILLEDLLLGYEQLGNGQPIQLQPKTTSYREWIGQLTALTQTDRLRNQLPMWQAMLPQPDDRLSVDFRDGRNLIGTADSVIVSLDETETARLLEDVTRTFRCRIDEALIAAAAVSLAHWQRRDVVALELESHGRDALLDSLDLTRTVGWFTARYPLRLKNIDTAEIVETLLQTKMQFRTVPDHGIGYGWLRSVAESPELQTPPPQVSFNYLGRLDRALPAHFGARLAAESAGPNASPASERTALLEITAWMDRGRLTTAWTYCPEIHDRRTIERVAEYSRESLRQLCETSQLPDAARATPADFPLAGLDQRAIDLVVGHNRDIEDVYPLSPAQTGMLVHSALDQETDAYFERFHCTFIGILNTTTLHHAWDAVLARHDVLRTGFEWETVDRPVQVVHRTATIPWVEHDLRGEDEDQQQRHIDEFLHQDRRQSFDFRRPPLMRIALFRLRDDAWRFVWSHHHLLLDGWSVPILLREVLLHYQAELAQVLLDFDPPKPYRDYIAWLLQQDRQRGAPFWQRLLGDFHAPTPLSIDRSSITSAQDGYQRVQIELSAELTAALEYGARQRKLTLNTLFQGAWGLVLSRYSGERDVVFGVTLSGRSAPLTGIESMVGVFIKTLPLRLSVDENALLTDWLGEVQQRQTEIREWEDSSLLDVQGWSAVPRGKPLFESLLVFENYPIDQSIEPDARSQLDVQSVHVEERTNYPLTLLALPGERLTLRALVDGDRLDFDAVQRLLGHLRHALTMMVAPQMERLRDIALIDSSERDSLLRCNTTDKPWRIPHLAAMYDRQCEQTPDRIALVDGEHQFSYAGLAARANALAHRLQSSGIGTDDRVGICIERSYLAVVSVLGVLKSGAAYLPLDPSYPQERLLHIIEDSSVRVLLSERRQESRLPATTAEVLWCDDWDCELAACPETPPTIDMAIESLGYVIHTSGSTGRPKGITLSHAALSNLILWHATELRHEARTLQYASLGFDASFHELFAAWHTGGTAFVIRDAQRRDVPALADFLITHQIEKVILPVVVLQVLAELLGPSANELTNLREIITTGEQLQITPAIIDAFRKLPGSVLHNHYGPSETHVVTAHVLSKDPETWPSHPPIGVPIANSQAYIFNAHLQLQPRGIVGELYLAGTCLARGYLHRPALTAERFVPCPESTVCGARMYRTGDASRLLHDDTLEFLGRLDDQVKIRGHRVEPSEVKAVLADHPAAKQVEVLLREDQPGDRRLVAYVVTEAGSGVTAEIFREVAARKLPDYAVPAEFVLLDTMPLNANGKVDRRRLPAPPRRHRLATTLSIPPRTPQEEALKELWSELLGVSSIGVYDNFFALGGHSLTAMQLLTRVRDRFGVSIRIRDLFESPTIAGLAEKLAAESTASTLPPIVPIPRDQPLPLSFAQHRLWVVDQLLPGSPLYNVPAAVKLMGPLNIEAMQAALNEIVRRHEVLRTTFSATDGAITQTIHAPSGLACPLLNIEPFPESDQAATIARLIHETVSLPFDLEHGPHLRCCLIRVNDAEHVFVIVMHHIVTDAWSLGILVGEFAVLYSAFATRLPSPLPELPVQYADYAAWQRDWLTVEVRAQQLNYWRQQLTPLPNVRLPADYSESAASSQRGASLPISLDEETSRNIRSLSRETGVTHFMTLLAGFQVALRHWMRQDDIVVGTDVANRTQQKTELLIGFFINQLVLRCQLADTMTFTDLLAKVREVTLAAYDHQELPFDVLLSELNPERLFGRATLFSAKLVLQNAPLPEVELEQLSVAPLPLDLGVAKFDLLVNIADSAKGFSGTAVYCADLFAASTMDRVMTNWSTVLSVATNNPTITLGEMAQGLAKAEQSAAQKTAGTQLKFARRKTVAWTGTQE